MWQVQKILDGVTTTGLGLASNLKNGDYRKSVGVYKSAGAGINAVIDVIVTQDGVGSLKYGTITLDSSNNSGVINVEGWWRSVNLNVVSIDADITLEGVVSA